MKRSDESAVRTLWRVIRDRLDLCLPNWTQLIDYFGQVAGVDRREAGSEWADDEVFEALLRAVLSNNTDWAKVERVLPELRETFFGFSLRRYAEMPAEEIGSRLVPWFRHRKAGSVTLSRSLLGLGQTARILSNWSSVHGSAEHYFLAVIGSSGGDPKRAAIQLGQSGSPKKLPALGVPIAAECLRNMGWDLCKPDRHVCRALGSFGMVSYRNWPDRTRTKAPQATADEMLQTMAAVERLADLGGVRPTLADNAVWLLCSRMGLYMSNAELKSMAVDQSCDEPT